MPTKEEITMAIHQVDSYQANFDPTGGRHYINLYKNNHQVGRIETSDTMVFHAVIDLMRNEGPNIYWRDAPEILHVGVEPVAEGED
jgi:hypothetical protein